MQEADSFKEFEATGWSERAATYELVTARVTSRLAQPMLDAAAVEAGARVLDLATGPGHTAAAALARGAVAVGVDLSEGMLALARERVPGAEFVLADAEELPFEDASFDAAVGGFIVNHLPHPERGAAELARVVRPGGRVALSMWDRPERARILGLMSDAVREANLPWPPGLPPGPDAWRFADDGELARLLEGAGFEEVRVEAIAFELEIESADALWHGLLGGSIRTAAAVQHGDEEARRRTREAFDRLLEQHRTGDGYSVPVAAKLASGRRP